MVDPAGAYREAHGGGHPPEVWATETPWLLRCGPRNIETRRLRLCVLDCQYGLAYVEQGVGGGAVDNAAAAAGRGVPGLNNPPRQATGPAIGP